MMIVNVFLPATTAHDVEVITILAYGAGVTDCYLLSTCAGTFNGRGVAHGKIMAEFMDNNASRNR